MGFIIAILVFVFMPFIIRTLMMPIYVATTWKDKTSNQSPVQEPKVHTKNYRDMTPEEARRLNEYYSTKQRRYY